MQGQVHVRTEKAINSKIHVPLYQYEYDALVSVIFNAGGGSAADDMADIVNAGNYSTIPESIRHFYVRNPRLLPRRSSEATFGPYIWRGPKAIFHYHIWNVIPSEAVYKQFAYYQLSRITDDIKRAAHGVAMPHITKAGMESWKLTLPPLGDLRAERRKLPAPQSQRQTEGATPSITH
ncbi:restriction endonuclease subunit S [Paraburkholderia dioscoreae]|nr:restriction endonuclease subunit S [Paraburkholderia dioscoreae]